MTALPDPLLDEQDPLEEPGPVQLLPEQDLLQDPLVQDPAPAPPSIDLRNYSIDYLLDLAAQRRQENEQTMEVLRHAMQRDPDTEAIVQRLGIDTGADPDVVRANIDKARQALQLRHIQELEMSKHSPILWAQLRNPQLAALAWDDFDRLSWFEKLGASLNSGMLQADRAKLYSNKLMGISSAEQDAEIKRIDTELERIGQVKGIWGHGQMIGQQLTWETGVAVGATLGSILVPFTAPVLGPVAVGAATVQGFRQNAGNSYGQYHDAGMVDYIAVRNSTIVGVVGSITEVLGYKIAAYPFQKAASTVIARSIAARVSQGALDSPTLKHAVGRFALRSFGQQASEVGEEIVQEGATALGQLQGMEESMQLKLQALDRGGRVYLGDDPKHQQGWIEAGIEPGTIVVTPDVYYRVTGEKLGPNDDAIVLHGELATQFLEDPRTRAAFGLASALSGEDLMSELLKMSADVAVQTWQSSFMFSVPGPASQMWAEGTRMRRAEAMREVYEETTGQVKATKLAQHSGVRMRDLLSRMWGDTELAEVHVDNARFREAMATVGATRETLAQKLPQVAAQLDKTAEEQPTIVMSGADFFATLAESKLQEALIDDAKPSASDLSSRQQKERYEEMQAQVAEMERTLLEDEAVAEAFDKDLEQERQKWMDSEIAAGVSYRVAKAASVLYAEKIRVGALAASASQGAVILPSEMLRRLNVTPRVLTAEQARARTGRSLQQMIGVIGAARLRTAQGEGAVPVNTAHFHSLEEAYALHQQGVDADTILERTGWSVGAEGKPRFEISDRTMQMIPMADLQAQSATTNETDIDAWPKLGDVIGHPVLFEAYPELRNVRVRAASLDPDTMGRVAYQTLPDGTAVPTIEVNDTADAAQVRSTLLHEIQHAIQGIEGFAQGGSTAPFMDPALRRASVLEPLQKFFPALVNVPQAVQTDLVEAFRTALDYATTNNPDDLLALQPLLVDLAVNVRMHREGFLPPGHPYAGLSQEAADAIYALVDVLGASSARATPFDLYWALAGEAEARATQDRATMGVTERRRVHPRSREPLVLVFSFFDEGVGQSYVDVAMEAVPRTATENLVPASMLQGPTQAGAPVAAGPAASQTADRSSLRINLSAATGKLPGIADLTEAAATGDDTAADVLHEVGIGALRSLLSGIESAEVHLTPTTGLYGGAIEPAIGATVTFNAADRAAVLAVLERFAQAFSQEQVHVREAVQDAAGSVYADGSFATPVVSFPLLQPLTRAEINQLAKDAGLAGFTVKTVDGQQTLEAYHLTDNVNDQAGVQQFREAAASASRLLGDRAGPATSTVARLWAYGSGWGATHGYADIRGDVRAPSPATAQPDTAGRVADWFATKGREIGAAQPTLEQIDRMLRHAPTAVVQGTKLAQRMTPAQKARALLRREKEKAKEREKAKKAREKVRERERKLKAARLEVERARAAALKPKRSFKARKGGDTPMTVAVPTGNRGKIIDPQEVQLSDRAQAFKSQALEVVRRTPEQKVLDELERGVEAAKAFAQGQDYVPPTPPPRRRAILVHLLKFAKRQHTYTKDGVVYTDRVFDGVPAREGMTEEQLADAIIGHAKQNLLALFNAMPPRIRNRARKWYPGARKMAKQLAKRYGLTVRQVAGMLAATSPQADWRMNVSYVERILDLVTKFAHVQATPEMSAWLESDFLVRYPHNIPLHERMRGKSLQDLAGDWEAQGLWIMAYDSVYSDRSFSDISPEGRILGPVLNDSGSAAAIGWKSIDPIVDALAIYHDERNIHEAIGLGHKVRNFFHNILTPFSEILFGTADTHHIAASLMLPIGSKSVEVGWGLGGGGTLGDVGIKGHYWVYHQAMIDAARELGILPRELQSVVWEGVRGLFPEEARRDMDFVGAVRDLWREYDLGNATHAETFERIVQLSRKRKVKPGRIGHVSWAKVSRSAGSTFEAGAATYTAPVPPTVGAPLRPERGSQYGVDVVHVRDDERGAGDGGADSDRAGRPGQLPGEGDVGGTDGGRDLDADGEGDTGDGSLPDDATLAQAEPGGIKAEFDIETFEIILHRTHDVTSLVHELGHFGLELHTRLWAAGLLPPEMEAHLQTIIDEVGKGQFATIEEWATAPLEARRKLHERVARLFEEYMAEGRAPSQRLRAVFHFLSQWMVRLYGMVRREVDAAYFEETGEHLPALTPEVRAVFDRWLASAEEVQLAQRDLAIGKLMQGIDRTPEEDELLENLILAQEAEAQEHLRAVHMRELAALRTLRGKRYAELQRASRAARQTREKQEQGRILGSDRTARVAHSLHTGQQRLWTSDERIPARYRTMNQETGIEPEALALSEGFASADEMFSSLRTLLGRHKNYGVAVDAMVQDATDERMLAEVPHLASEELMQLEVDRAISNEAMLRLRAEEMRLLNKGLDADLERDMVAIARAAAQVAIGKLKVGDLFGSRNSVHRFAEAARRAEIDAAAARGDIEAMRRHQRTAIMQRALAHEAGRRREVLVKKQDRLERLLEYNTRRKGSEERKAKVYGGAVMDTARLIANTLGLKVALRPIAGAQQPWASLMDPDDSTKNSPEAAELSQAHSDMLQTVRVHGVFANQSVDVAWNSMLQIEGVIVRGRIAREFELEGRTLHTADVLKEIEKLIAAARAPVPPKKEPKSWLSRAKRGITSHLAATQRIEQRFYAMDGDTIGVLHQLLFAPARDAEDQTELNYGEVLVKLLPLLQKMRDGVTDQPSLHRAITSDRDDTGRVLLPDPDAPPGDDGRQQPHVFERGKLDILGCLLHAGNKSNLDRLMIGFKWGTRDADGNVDHAPFWAQVTKWEAAGLITKADWDLVQGIWDIYGEHLLPGVKRAHYEVVGFEMEVVPAGLPDLTARGLKGGYVPAARNKWTQGPTAARYGNDNVLKMQQSSPSVHRGMTKQRVDEEDNDPLDIDPLRQLVHFRQSVLFSTMAPAHRKIAILLRDKDIERALEQLSPGFYENHVNHWLQTVASLMRQLPGANTHDMLKGLDIIDVLRTNAGTAAMFGNVINSVQGVTGAVLAMARVKPKFLLRGAFDGPSAAEVYAMSPFLETRHRLNVSAFEMQQQIVELVRPGGVFTQGVRAFRNWLVRNTYWMQELIQKPLDFRVWRGAYLEATADPSDGGLGYSQEKAVQHANQAVRATQSDTAVTSLASAEKGGRFQQLFMQFSGWFISMGSLRASVLHRAGVAGRVAEAQGGSPIAAMVGKMLTAREVWSSFFTLYLGEVVATMLASEDEEEEERSALGRWVGDPLYQTTLAAPRMLGPVGAFASTIVAALTRADAYQQRMPAPSVLALISRTAAAASALTKEDAGLKEGVDMTEQFLKAWGVPVHLLTSRLRKGADVFDEESIEPSIRGAISGR